MRPAQRDLFAHLTLAIARYLPEAHAEARKDGRSVPQELLNLADFFADCARTRPVATEGAVDSTSAEAGVMTDSVLLTKREAALVLRVSVRQLERLIADPDCRLDVVRVGGAPRLRRSDLDAYVSGLGGGSFRDQVSEKGSA